MVVSVCVGAKRVGVVGCIVVIVIVDAGKLLDDMFVWGHIAWITLGQTPRYSGMRLVT